MKKQIVLLLIILCTITLLSCTKEESYLHIQNVGMLMEDSVSDSIWNEKGYDGLLEIGQVYDVNVYTKEKVITKEDIIKAVDEFVYNGVNLIFGHSNHYGRFFVEIADDYPDVHFVYFNGGTFKKGVTSLNFNFHPSGFLSGMIAGKMTETNQVGVIAAYEWQTEIEGFYEGVKFQNPDTQVHVQFMNNWSDKEEALEIYHKMQQAGVDVFNPISDTFSTEIIEAAQEDKTYAFGYIEDESEKYPDTVLTSTIQHIEKLYLYTAEKFNKEELEPGILTFGLKDGTLALGKYSSDIPFAFQIQMNQYVNNYLETDLLPYEY